ncbi:MAG: hypothetical protein CL693_14810 [Cellvibrionaceae bacterium]|nr:hypothetical protein [Cellvibrionaceae bacterium]|tara:strand:- start:689 stop:1048 length:360 start_codon:yes stop_codon:yes gene_type:complete
MKFTPQKFDELLELAQSDPEALERYRQQQIELTLSEAPECIRARLEGLQFQIDAQRSLHHNPMGTCIKLSQMMQDSFQQLQAMLERLTDGSLLDNIAPPKQPQKSAKILPFSANSPTSR